MATTETVKIVSDPEVLDIKGKPATKIRFVIKAPGKRYLDRFVNMMLFGKDGEDAARLSKGDVVQVTGPLCQSSYFSKKEKREVTQDEMGFGSRIERVIKSESFFGRKEETATETPAEPDTEGKGPLDDLDL